jgi:hypothetical protein
VYQSDAEQTAFDQTLKGIKSDPAFRGYSVNTGSIGSSPASLHTETKEVDQAMFPVWFMSYRNGDRVAYATVNGQTGKVVADIPVDIKKFLLGSLLLAVPIFIVLSIFFTVIPTTALTVTGVLAVIALILSSCSISQIIRRENNEDDLGFLYVMNPKKFQEVRQRRRQTPGVQTKKSGKNSIVGIIILFYVAFILVMGFGAIFLELLGSALIWIGILLVGLIAAISGLRKIGEVPGKKGLTGMIMTTVGILIGAAMIVVNPVSDLWYYGAVILLILAVTIMEKELIEQYNLTATRKLPQFNKQGGDDRA